MTQQEKEAKKRLEASPLAKFLAEEPANSDEEHDRNSDQESEFDQLKRVS